MTEATHALVTITLVVPWDDVDEVREKAHDYLYPLSEHSTLNAEDTEVT